MCLIFIIYLCTFILVSFLRVLHSGNSCSPSVLLFSHRKKKCYTKPHDESKPYVKRPPNAFLLFRMEQRPLVEAELRNAEGASVNKVIGQRWKSMSKEEQAIYYEYAEREMQIHLQLFPEWSNRDNYGKKRKRIRRKGPSTTEDCVI
ncbi:transcription factor 7-like 2 [Hippoglossus hippoglossus]|uniref:transcription factor 7-like 2 n=1 Tax=Hippoglossus hippoglossus TaxID=8267 RepID=UPI00148DC256|nr:transcription factor 7-like 2 [Hippoglossus hippoglossus]